MINPLVYTEKVVRSFLRYQLTTYPFADRRLSDQRFHRDCPRYHPNFPQGCRQTFRMKKDAE